MIIVSEAACEQGLEAKLDRPHRRVSTWQKQPGSIAATAERYYWRSDLPAALLAALTGRIYDHAPQQNAAPLDLITIDMSLFEWLGETHDPAPSGTIEGGSPQPIHWHPRVIVFRGVVAVALVAAVGVGIARIAQTATETIALAVAVAVYCGIAYWVTPRPDPDNVGWAGGLVDHPFRWSDDVNRGLVFLRVVLWPGRFLTVSLRDIFRFWRGQRFMVLPPRQ